MASNDKSVKKEAFLNQNTITAVSFGKDCKTVGDSAFENCSELSNINDDNKIENIGANAFAHTGLTSVSLPEGEIIGDNAFNGCTKLTNVTINNNCSFIGKYAFGNCEKLTSIEIPDNENFKTISERTFQDCKCIKSIKIPSGVKTIGSYAFNGCNMLNSVTFNNNSNIENIEGGAFFNCSSITNIIIPHKTANIGCTAFNGCNKITDVNIENGAGELKLGYNEYNATVDASNNPNLGKGLFADCPLKNLHIGRNLIYESEKQYGYSPFYKKSSLTSVTIASSVTNIGNQLLRECDGIKNIVIPNTVTSIGYAAFYQCKSLTDVSFGNGVKTIGGEAFNGCGSLTKIIIPDSVETIGKHAFYRCETASSVVIGNNVKTINDGAFQYCKSVQNITIPNKVTSIGASAFCGCSNLTNVSIGDNVKTIGNDAFKDCSKIEGVYINNIASWCDMNFGNGTANPLSNSTTSTYLYENNEKVIDIDFPESISNIKSYTFYGYKNLERVIIPNSVTTIGSGAFEGCTGLKTVVDLSPHLTISSGSEDNGHVATYASRVIKGTSRINDFIFNKESNENNELVYHLKSDVTDITLPSHTDGKYDISDSVFVEHTKLTKFTIPDNTVASIGERVFEGCEQLTDVSIGDGVTNIGNGTFKNCGITSMTIPNTVTNIGNEVFNGCSSLTELNIKDNDDGSSDSEPPIIEIGVEHNTSNNNNPLNLGYNTYVSNKEGKGLFKDCPIQKLHLGRNLTYKSDKQYGFSPFYGISTLTSVSIGNNVTEIGENAFCYCSGLTSITIPNSITNIGKSAFKNCTGLTNISISNNITNIKDYVFSGCRKLKSITIPKGVTSIGIESFYICDSLETIIIPNSVSSIGESAFEGCDNLTDITIGNNITHIDVNAFSKCNNIENVYIKNISDWYKIEFENENSNPASFSQGFYLNEDSEKIKNLIIPNDITQINNYAFYKFASLENIIIPNSVESIGDSAFNLSNTNKYNIKRVVIGNGITNIGEKAFYFNYNNAAPQVGIIIIGKNFPKLSEDSYYNYISNKKINFSKHYYTYNCINIEQSVQKGDFMFGSDITNIEYNYLYSYIGDGIGDLYLPNNYGSAYGIGECAFYNCDMLENIIIPNGVTSIGEYAFYGCNSLTSVTIPNSVKIINNYAFNGCDSLKYIHIADDNNLEGDEGIFNDNVLLLGYNKVNERDLFLDCKSTLQTVYLGRHIADPSGIDNHSENYENLKTFIIGNNIKTFSGNELSRHCPNIKHIIIGNSIKRNINNEYANIEENSFSSSIKDHIIINFSNSKINTEKNHVGYNSKKIINYINNEYDTFKSYKEGDFIFATINKMTILCIYFGDSMILTLPNYYKNDNKTEDMNSLSHLTYDIGEYAFYGCNNLTNVVIGNMVIDIENNAFEDCINLKSINIHNRVQYVGCNAFNNCKGLETIIIGKNVTTESEYTTYIEGKKTIVDSYNIDYMLGEYFVNYPNNIKTLINFSSIDALEGGYCDEKIINVREYIDIEDDYYNDNGVLISKNCVFANINGNNTLCGYIGNDSDTPISSITLPTKYTNKNNEEINIGDYAIGEFAFYEFKNLQNITIPNTVTSIGDSAFESDTKDFEKSPLKTVTFENNSKVEKIGFAAFRNCFNLTSITIPDSVISIGDYAFDTNGIETLVIGKNVTSIGNYAFAHCWLLESVTIPDSVTSIKNSTFYDCYNLISVKIGNGIASIGENAFYNCKKLTNITISNSVTSIGEEAFGETTWYNNQPDGVVYVGKVLYKYKGKMPEGTSINIKEGTLGIADCAFSGCTGLTSVTIPNSVTSIGNDAFYNCSSLTSVTIGNSVTSIGDWAFADCSITSVTIPNSVTSIGKNAFNTCKELTNIIIGKNVTTIDEYAFEGCSRLETVINLSNNLTISKESEYNGYVGYYADKVINVPNGSIEGDFVWANIDGVNTLCGYIGNDTVLTLPVNYKGENYVIGEKAFYNCSRLTSVTIPNSVTNIGDYAFSMCNNLQSVTFSDNSKVKSIGKGAFYGCNDINFKNINIPASVTTIGYGVFRNCPGLEQITVESGNNIYDSRDNCNAIIETATNKILCGCKNTKIPNNIKKIGAFAFEGCAGNGNNTGITNISIPESIIDIEDYAFSGCSDLTLTIEKRTTTPPQLGKDVFYNISGQFIKIHDNNLYSFTQNEYWSVYKKHFIYY